MPPNDLDVRYKQHMQQVGAWPAVGIYLCGICCNMCRGL